MVKVLMFGWEFPPHHSGGLGIACQGLTRGLSRQDDVEVTFVLPKKVDLDVPYLKFVYAEGKGAITKEYFINSSLQGYVTSESYEEHLKRGKAHPMYASNLHEEVMRYASLGGQVAKEEDFDVIHAHDWLTFQAGIAAKKASGKPLVIHVHATEFDRGGGNGVNQTVYDIEKKGMEEADKIIAGSGFTKKKIIKHYGINPDKIKVVHNGTEFEDLIVSEMHDLKKSKKIVLFLGRLTLQKGPDYFVETAKKVADHYPDVAFVVVGSGDMEQAMIRQVANLGLADKFIFAGWFKKESEIQRAYQMADMFIMPSVSEPFGLVPLESIHSGTPALISHQSGVSEVVTNCLKSDFWDTDDMANKIVSVLRHRALHNTLKENGKKEIDKITWDKPAKRCVDIYNEMVEENK